MKKYVWLNIETGKFSDSWDEETHNRLITKEEIEEHTIVLPTWKLICYECINDSEFEFNDHMVIK